MKRKVVLSQALPEAAVEQLRSDCELIVPPEPGQEAFEKAAAAGEAIILRTNVAVTRELVAKCPDLKVVSRTGAGADNVDVAACNERGVKVGNLPGVNNVSVAEHAVTLMLTLWKSLPLMTDSVRNGDWKIRLKNIPREINGKTVGVVGMGAIGSIAARILKDGFGAKVLAYDPYMDPEKFSGYAFTDDLGGLFAESDLVTLHLPSLPSTRNIVNADLLGRMRPHAVVVNCSRGDIIDENALYDALASGKIAGAGLDVFAQEPPAADNRLLTLPNVVLSPHTAALTKEAAARMSSEACRQVAHFFRTGELLWEYRPPMLRRG
jgi:D-3-phosphoglycerate dehydrogenase